MAHRMVSGLEGVPKGVGRERRCQDIVISETRPRVPESLISSQERGSFAYGLPPSTGLGTIHTSGHGVASPNCYVVR